AGTGAGRVGGMPQIAIYPGSFDPITVGHVDVITRGAKLFDRLLVAVGDNPAKRYWFDREARVDLVRRACAGCDNVEVVSFSGRLVDAAERLDATVSLRGLRAPADIALEFRNGLGNRVLTRVEPVFQLAAPRSTYVASSP